jgi:proliferating cell nuclear antigen|tara:strand:+ start:7505 stop:8263 length:759 start_codon:yes stop_codon:yes gene_type:complete
LVFLAKASSAKEWKRVAAAIGHLVEEASFDASPEEISFRAMDPSHVAMIDLVWPNTAFEKYECDKQFRFTVRVDDLVKVLRRAESKDAIELSAADDQTLIFKIFDGYRREFKIHLVESTAAPTPIPKLSFNAKLQAIQGTIEKMLNDISVVSDHVIIEAGKDKVILSGKSDHGSAAVELEKGSPDLPLYEVKEESKATYSIDYLLNISKAAASVTDSITCEYSNKMPLRMEFKLAETGGQIHFYLAPRVEEK